MKGVLLAACQLDIAQFADAGDIYTAFMVSKSPQSVFNVAPDLSFQAYTVQLILQALATGQPPVRIVPLVSSATSPVDTTLFAKSDSHW